ncbi:uncharacterized protein VTP21DRAFT_11494 [Calcarisporiella thermophila]|uniref:uncharacterized protein n=1 Tax=Calcarisporiella thermophila TaxID=911321 RepID=UPI0037424DA7
MRIRLFLPLLILSIVPLVIASIGDSSPDYQNCVAYCRHNTCGSNPPLPLSLRLTGWTCASNCGYNCMRTITQEAMERGDPIVQYHGKWPFVRVLGVQEPASVIFSLLNGWVHYKHWKVLSRLPDSLPIKKFLLGNVIVGLNTWLWSSVFHTRDTSLTEKLDYFSAGFGILYGLYLALLRVFGVNRLVLFGGGFVLLSMFIAHVSYLSFWRFDYSYNMAASVAVGVVHNFVWSIWATWAISHGRKYAWRSILCFLLITVAMSLELLDFPPIWEVFDAHSLWHAATIFITPIWYRFLLLDAKYEASLKGKMKQ